MPHRLKRITGRGDLHFITFCCYQRRPLLGPARVRNLAVKILRQVRARYGFALVGFVFMPEHVHLLLSESGCAPPARIIQVFKQRLSRRIRGKKRGRKGQLALCFPGNGPLRRFWQRRYYDFNVYSRARVLEKLHYMHFNPVREKLVDHPGDWPWSSWCFYFRGAGCWKWILGFERKAQARTRKERPTLCQTKTAKGRPPRKSLRIVGRR